MSKVKRFDNALDELGILNEMNRAIVCQFNGVIKSANDIANGLNIERTGGINAIERDIPDMGKN